MKKIIIILAVILTSCGTYKEAHFKEVSGTISEITYTKPCFTLKVNQTDYTGYYDKYIKIGDSVKIKYFYSERNNKNNIQTLKLLK